MVKPVKLAVFCGLILATLPVSAQETGLLELGVTPPKDTIVPIGSVPPKKVIALDLGALRTDEAQLPAAPLTRSQRMALRAKKAMSRQRAVSNASRQRVARRQRQQRPPEDVMYDQDEGFPMGPDGEPILE
jgi:hypothetical protein